MPPQGRMGLTSPGKAFLRRWAKPKVFLDFHHVKIKLADTTIGALPVFRYILPFGARLDSIVRPTLGLIVDETANHTFPLFKVTHSALFLLLHTPRTAGAAIVIAFHYECSRSRKAIPIVTDRLGMVPL